jgi:presenilin-like A22 family membrane protease
MGIIRFLLRLLLKLIALPVMILLTITLPIMLFLYSYAAWLMNIISGFCMLGGVAFLFFMKEWGSLGKWQGAVFILIAFLFSPYGLQACAEWIIEWATEFKYTLRDFIRS